MDFEFWIVNQATRTSQRDPNDFATLILQGRGRRSSALGGKVEGFGGNIDAATNCLSAMLSWRVIAHFCIHLLFLHQLWLLPDQRRR